jgi:hypothetical protein
MKHLHDEAPAGCRRVHGRRDHIPCFLKLVSVHLGTPELLGTGMALFVTQCPFYK